jgi:hypothetical protein
VDENRRTTFRAALVDAPAAALVCGRASLDVQLVNESSGGLSVVADIPPSFPLDAEAELHIADGRVLRVLVKNYAPQGEQTRIGLQRREVPILGRPADPPPHSTSAITYAAVLLVGLLLGFLVLSGPIKQWLLQLPGVAHIPVLGPKANTPEPPSGE